MDYYNMEHKNKGRYSKGRTPYEIFTNGLNIYQQYLFEDPVELKEAME